MKSTKSDGGVSRSVPKGKMVPVFLSTLRDILVPERANRMGATMRTSGEIALQQYLKTLDALDRESDALFESIRPALQAIRDNRTAVYLEMLEALPASVLYEFDRLYQRPLWGCNVDPYIKGQLPERVRDSIECGEGLFTVKHGSCWGLSPRGRDMMSDDRVRSRLKEIMATDDFRRATKDLG